MNAHSKLLALKNHLNTKFLERSEIVDGLLIALLAKQSIFLLGNPGTAKSAISEEICKSVQGEYFSWCLSKFTKPEELFGPIDLKSLEAGEYRHLTKHKLPEAKIAMIDECFKASSAVLNTMLTVINERKFFNGNTEQACPLETLVCASNEVPDSGELAAFFDRLVLKYEAKNLQNDSSVETLLKSSLVPTAQAPSLSTSELAELQKQVESCPVSNEVISLLVQIRRAITQEGIYISERKLKQALLCCMANAVLNGHAEVLPEDLELLRHILWQRLDQQKVVSKIVYKLANPLGEIVQNLKDALEEVAENLQEKKIQPLEAQSKVSDSIEKIEDLIKKNQNSESLKSLLKLAKEKNAWICRDFLKLRI